MGDGSPVGGKKLVEVRHIHAVSGCSNWPLHSVTDGGIMGDGRIAALAHSANYLATFHDTFSDL